MISRKYKCIFVHIIKTGGVSVATALKMRKTHCHMSASAIRKRVGEKKWNSYFKFSFVRNPYDKLVSQYHYNRQSFGYEDATFKEYATAFGEGKQISTYPQLNSWYLDEEVDFVGRFENLQQDFETVCEKIGATDLMLPHKNKSKHKHYTEYYDDEIKQIVAEKYALDIENFGYGFGD